MIINTDKKLVKRDVKVVLIILLTPIVFIILAVIFMFASSPIFDKFDHDKFITLDTQIQGLFKDIKAASDSADDWKYVAVCTPDKSGWLETGKYHCVASISMQKTITSVNELNDLQAKYYPMINSSDTLTKKTELDPEPPNVFGKQFAASSAEQKYTENKSNVECTYLIKLYQNSNDPSRTYEENVSFGSSINGGVGKMFISLNCFGMARDAWYPLSDTADLIIPEY